MKTAPVCLLALLLGCSGAPAPDAGACAAACVPTGTWDLRVESDGGCAQSTYTLEISSDGGVRLDRFGVGCGGAGSGSVAFSTDGGCGLHLELHQGCVFSGEQQCEDATFDLAFCGPAATGSLVYGRCWCRSYRSVLETDPVRGTRR